jgi:hypothetical protein
MAYGPSSSCRLRSIRTEVVKGAATPMTAALVCGVRVQTALALPQNDVQARQCALRDPDRAPLQEHRRTLSRSIRFLRREQTRLVGRQ